MKKFSIMTLVFSGVLLGSAPILASDTDRTDYKRYPGSNCHKGHEDTWITKNLIYNNSPKYTVGVNCPIVNDLGKGIAFADVRVVDRDPVKNVHCTLWSMPNNSYKSGYYMSRSTGNYYNGPSPVSLLFRAYLQGDRYSSYTMHCYIPPTDYKYSSKVSGILHYEILEGSADDVPEPPPVVVD